MKKDKNIDLTKKYYTYQENNYFTIYQTKKGINKRLGFKLNIDYKNQTTITKKEHTIVYNLKLKYDTIKITEYLKA